MEQGEKNTNSIINYLGQLELTDNLREQYEKAYSIAQELGLLVGRTTRYWEIPTGSGTPVKIEVSPETYYGDHGSLHRVGDYLAVVDPKTLKIILLRITRIIRHDALAKIKLEPPISHYSLEPDIDAIATSTIIEAEPLMEARYPNLDEPVPASTSIEPQSPVIDPNPEIISKLLGLPVDGLFLGSLAHPSGLIKEGRIPVYLPYKAVLQHVLVIGTTGSGKTTLIKNVISSIYTGATSKPVVVVVDMNQDYIQLAFGPNNETRRILEQDPVYLSIKDRLKHPRGILLVLPITITMLKEKEGENPYKEVISDYIKNSLLPLVEKTISNEPILLGSRKNGVEFYRVRLGSSEFLIIPYSISTIKTNTESLLGMIPGLTMFARDTLRILRERFKRKYQIYPPLSTILAAVKAYIAVSHSRGIEKEDAIDASKDLVLELIVPNREFSDYYSLENAYAMFKFEDTNISLLEIVKELYDIIDRMSPHVRTLESLYRRLYSTLEAGLIDLIEVSERERELRIVREPQWSNLIELARKENYPIVIDLKPSIDTTYASNEGSRLTTYRLLNSLAAWKQYAYSRRRRTDPVLVVIDEAHQFFPQEHGSREEQEANRQVASMISRIARLGRARGIGLLFASHSPKDLHDIIIQLSNTKIILRTERHQLERLEIDPLYKHYIPRLPDRYMIVQSHVFKDTSVMARTCLPVSLHFDVSALF